MATSKSIGYAGIEHLTKAGVSIDDDQIDIQKVAESDLARIAGEESFMQELVTIRIAQSIDQNASPYAVLVCNGAENRIVVPRGKPTVVKRMHVEILARMKELRYNQRQAQSGNLEDGNMLYQSVGQVYPFEIVKDDNPVGRTWCENILAEPA
jgi:hypothetical protein